MRCYVVSAVGLALALALAPVALADWDHEVKWDQLPYDTAYLGSSSFINDLTQTYATTADDFLCTEAGWITDIEFTGFADNVAAIEAFRVKFWSDVPATPNEESRPGEIVYDATFGPVEASDPLGLGWKQTDDLTFKINIPRELWFEQVGGAAAPIIYWISIQAVIDSESTGDRFYWQYRDRTAENWGDDAVFQYSWGYDPWWHWGWINMTPGSSPGAYASIFPNEWAKSTDMSFKLTGTPIPEPATIGLIALGVLGLLYRRKR